MTRVAVVTGANRGLGYECARQLAKAGLRVVLTSRSEESGVAAAEELKGEGLDVRWMGLDVTDVASIQALAAGLTEAFGAVDVLVNNAGVFMDKGSERSAFSVQQETMQQTFLTNATGPLMVTQGLAELLKAGGYCRVVNVSSTLGQLASMAGGYPAYRSSKAALNAVTRVLADEFSQLEGDYKVNSMCPGWVHTDMGGPNAPLTPEQGVDTMVWLATLAADGPSGGFWHMRQTHEW